MDQAKGQVDAWFMATLAAWQTMLPVVLGRAGHQQQRTVFQY
jgi:hypothetical protein